MSGLQQLVPGVSVALMLRYVSNQQYVVPDESVSWKYFVAAGLATFFASATAAYLEGYLPKLLVDSLGLEMAASPAVSGAMMLAANYETMSTLRDGGAYEIGFNVDALIEVPLAFAIGAAVAVIAVQASQQLMRIVDRGMQRRR